jgi:response regulator RpfG family c-di-GMP phosphodiesterase
MISEESSKSFTMKSFTMKSFTMDVSAIRVFDAVRAVAFVGDLSMGQPTDHSVRAAWIAGQIAVAEGLSAADCGTIREASLLRWSGCTANAPGFAELFGDDVAGREAMLAMRPVWAPTGTLGAMNSVMEPLVRIHCEVSGEVARMLGLGGETEMTLRHIFETFDGKGMPDRMVGERVPVSVFIVSLAGDLEILSRVHGLERALALIASKAGTHYPERLLRSVTVQAGQWLRTLERREPDSLEGALLTEPMGKMTSPELIADVIDLKLPWMTGYSRGVAEAAGACCAQLGLDAPAQNLVYRAGLIHGIGRAAIPNTVWCGPNPLPASAWETIRLAPYWTSRVGKQIGALGREAEIGSFAFERLDGSGYFRGVSGNAIPIEGRVLAAAVAWVALRSPRPWRPALSPADAASSLTEMTRGGLLDPNVVPIIASAGKRRVKQIRMPNAPHLSPRETDVLRRISLGASNKEVARALELSPSTVRTHVESVFRKLQCSTRAAATLKASAMGLL